MACSISIHCKIVFLYTQPTLVVFLGQIGPGRGKKRKNNFQKNLDFLKKLLAKILPGVIIKLEIYRSFLLINVLVCETV